MKIIEYSPENFQDLESTWKKLEVGSDMTIFQSYEWYRWLNYAYAKEKVKNCFRKWIYLLCLGESGNPIMIAPLQIIKIGKAIKGIGINKGIYFIGRKGFSDYLNFIYDEFESEACDAIFEHLQATIHNHEYYFENILETTGFCVYLKDKYTVKIKKSLSCAALTLPETFEDYYSILKKHAKQNIRTAINRQKRDELDLHHEVIFSIDVNLQEILWNIRAQRLRDKKKRDIKKLTSRIYNWARDTFVIRFNAKTNIFDCYNEQWCLLVKKKEQIVGFYWGIRDLKKKCYYVILAGVDKEYAWYSPSLSHLYLWIQELYATGKSEIKVIDFTVGNEKYKTDIGGSVRYIQNLNFSI